MKLKVTVEIQKMNEGDDSYKRDTIYEQTKEFTHFNMMSVITAFNKAEKDSDPFLTVDPAEMTEVAKGGRK